MKNHNLDIYRKLSLLYIKGIYLSDILHFMGIETVYLYGAGEMGELVLSDLSGKVKIPAIFDRDKKKHGVKRIWTRYGENCSSQKVWYEYPVFSIEEIPNDEIPLLITPSSGYFGIADDLSKRGIPGSRLFSFNLILHYGIYYLSMISSGQVVKYQNTITKEFLITGAQFNNKGAQNMSYIAISEIRKRYPDSVIWYIPNYGEAEYRNVWDKYKIIFLLDGTDIDSTLYEVIPRLSGVVDISGTAWAIKDGIGKKINCFHMAYTYGIPIYFMPQSFSLAAFKTEANVELKKILSYARIIYAREEEGYNFLTNTLGLNNVKKSEDIVLQNVCLHEEYIFANKEKDISYKLSTKHNIAVIPNMQNYKYGNPETVNQLYKDAIRKLLLFNKNVYIISYAEDKEVCTAIYEDFLNHNSVYLYDKEFDCIGFRELVKNFEYIIASRFHSIVNAYKEYIPCVIIGWLEKYIELSKKFQQSNYLFDVRKNIDTKELILAIQQLEQSWEKESEKIASILPELQKENCFDILNNI